MTMHATWANNGQVLKKDFVKRMRNQNRQPRPPAFDGFEGSVHDDFTTK